LLSQVPHPIHQAAQTARSSNSPCFECSPFLRTAAHMASRELRPVLEGQKLKSRKRDVKEKFDPAGFRDELIAGILEAGGAPGGDIEDGAKFLENNTEADYRRYNEQLFDILIAGGLLAPGGSIVADGAAKNPFSCFEAENDHEALKRHAEIIRALVRRYKYLQVSLEESFVKILKFLNGFEEENITKLAQTTAFIFSMGLMSTKPLLSMEIESVVSTGLARTFITQLFRTWTKLSSMNAIGTALRKTGVDQKLHLLFPQNARTMQAIVGYFNEQTGFDQLCKWYTGLQTAEVKKELQAEISQMLKDETPQDALIERVRAVQEEHRIAESEVTKLMWPAIMGAVEWNKKAELMIEQALRHVKSNLKFLARWTKSDRAQIVLMVTMQEFCFVNQNFLKIYNRFCLLFYKAEILGEDAILSWHSKDHSTKGKSVFLADMNEFVNWLKSAEYEDA